MDCILWFDGESKKTKLTKLLLKCLVNNPRGAWQRTMTKIYFSLRMKDLSSKVPSIKAGTNSDFSPKRKE